MKYLIKYFLAMRLLPLMVRAYLTNNYKFGAIGNSRNTRGLNLFPIKVRSASIFLGGSCNSLKRKSFSSRQYASEAGSSITKSLDPNALPDSKRRLVEISQKIESNLGKDVIDYKALVSSLKDMETVHLQ